MRAAVVSSYGPSDRVEIIETPSPSLRGDDVLVRVVAASVNSGDARIRGARFPRGFGIPARLALGVRKPRRPILGVALAGVVDEPGISGFARGDRVCGMVGARMGAHAEFAAVRADRLVRVPTDVDLPAAAAILFGGTTAMHYLHRVGKVAPGHRVLVSGASGAVGLAAVQVARRAGARVTALTSAANADVVTRHGAAVVLDYRSDDPAAHGPFDLVLDAVGTMGPADADRLLTPNGKLLLIAASLWQTMTARGRVHAGVATESTDDVAALLAGLAANELDPTIEATLPLDEIRLAHERVDSGRKVGSILVTP